MCMEIKKKKRSDEKTFYGLKINPNVALPSLFIVLTLVIAILIIGKPMENWFMEIQDLVSVNVGWFFILLLNLVLIFSLYIGFGKFGKVRIGGKDAKPSFSLGAWFAMLFSAGMGIGLLFWSVAEPISHYNNNPWLGADTSNVARAKKAMDITFMHWGVHAWALYAIVGLALAYFTFNKKLPLTIRSIFYPILKEKIHGKWGDLVDVISVVATIFGLATTLGFGVQQVNAGFTYLFGAPESLTIQILLIIFITILATMSLVFGLERGVRLASEWNMKLALVLLLFVLIIGPTRFLLQSYVENIGSYFGNILELGTWTASFKSVVAKDDWQKNWTIFYWAWWISWAPFVGIFIARISKGRTFREFIIGVLLVPSLFTFFWMTVFGGSALYQELLGNSSISQAVDQNIATSIYFLLAEYPFPVISSSLTVVLVIGFFVTSSDSGSYVVDTLTSGGRHDVAKGQKVFWASMEGLIAAALLLGGGLVGLQAMTLLTAVPFALVLIVMCYSFHKALSEDKDL